MVAIDLYFWLNYQKIKTSFFGAHAWNFQSNQNQRSSFGVTSQHKQAAKTQRKHLLTPQQPSYQAKETEPKEEKGSREEEEIPNKRVKGGKTTPKHPKTHFQGYNLN